MIEKKCKILFCMHLPPPVHGASVVGQQIFDSMLIRSSFDCVFMNLSASGKVEEIGHFSLKKLISMLRFYYNMLKTIKQENPDLVYITPSSWDWGFYRDCFTMALLKYHHRPVVAHFHNKPQPAFTHKWYNKCLYKKFFANVNTIFLSEKLSDTFRQYIAPQHIHICPNGIARTSAERATPIEHAYTFLFVSNMMEEKGVYVLLEACAILKKRGLNFLCDFVGRWSDVSEAAFWAKCSELGIKDRIRAHGAKYGKEKEACFLQADAFVFPTFYHGECLSLVVLEAMQHALPIITTDEGALSEVVNDGRAGLIVEKQDPRSLAEKMEYLIQNQEKGREMGIQGLAKYEKEYTTEVFENRLCSILQDCIQNDK